MDPKQQDLATKLAFRFLDYDNSGTIGSVDILNLKESFDEDELERIHKLFMDSHVKDQLGSKLSNLFKTKKSGAMTKEGQKKSTLSALSGLLGGGGI